MSQRLNQYQAACDKFVATQLQDDKVIGILGCGSFFNGTIDENSDIDIFIILDESVNYRERGNTWIDGIEIEYFKNPPQQIKEYIHCEEHKHSAHIFSTGTILHDKKGVVAQLKTEAQAIENSLSKPMSTDAIELAKYFIDDKYKDWLDAVAMNDSIAQKFTQSELEDFCITTFFKLNRQRRGKSKHLGKTIQDIDPKFASLIKENNITKIKEYTEKLLGGKRNKECVFRSDLTV